MDDAVFQRRAEAALDHLSRSLGRQADRFGFEVDFNAGALTVEFDDPPGKFVVSPNSPVRQIWVSANVRSYKLDWDESTGTFVLAGRNLEDLMAACVSEFLGEEVKL